VRTDYLNKTKEELLAELEELQVQLHEATETIDAIRTGQIDALVVHGSNGHQIYTLKSADQTYRVFIEKMTEGAVTLNQQGIILYANSRFAAMVDCSLSAVIGLPFQQFVVAENRPQYTALFAQCWKADCKGEVLLKAGENKTPVQLSLTTLELEEGVSLSIILTDLTAQKRTQEQLHENNLKLEESNLALETSNHDLQQFASIASHDLQEPLRKITMFANLLKEQSEALLPEAKRYLEKIIESSSRMKTLIIDILNYSKLSARDHLFEPVDLNKIVADIKEDFELVMAEKSATIHCGELPVLAANKGQIRQVFQNIISNALKFTQPGVNPVIAVRAKRIGAKSFAAPERADGGYFLLSFKDNGIGFGQQYVQHIFSLFERLNSKDKYEGTGIGLAIAKKIVEKHNGLITAVSKEGEGSEFQIILPLAQNLV
jgi:PAS domain S-box-containing protein